MTVINLQSNYPTTLEQAISKLQSELSQRTLTHIKDTPEDKLSMYHFGIGTKIRNMLGIADGSNMALLEDCGCDHADGASGFIIWQLWKELKQDV